MVYACFFPFVLIVNAVSWLRDRAEWAGVICWIFLWPVWVCSRFVVVPLMSHASRRHEFEADARAASLGDTYRLGLRRALTELSVWERPRNGWEEVLAATHPPTEARLERLETPVPAPIPAMTVEWGPKDDPDIVISSPAVQAAARRQAEADARYKKATRAGDALEIEAALREQRTADLASYRAILHVLDAGEYEVRHIGPTWLDDKKAWLARKIESVEASLGEARDAKPKSGTTRPRKPPEERAVAPRPSAPRPPERSLAETSPERSTATRHTAAPQPTPSGGGSATDQPDDPDVRWSIGNPSEAGHRSTSADRSKPDAS